MKYEVTIERMKLSKDGEPPIRTHLGWRLFDDMQEALAWAATLGGRKAAPGLVVTMVIGE